MIKFCKKCQCETERYSIGNRCKTCAKARRAGYYEANPEGVKAYRAAWNAANTEKRKATTAAWYAANTEKMKAINTVWRADNHENIKVKRAAHYASNSEKIKAQSSLWYAANHEKSQANNAAWQKANPETCRIYKQNRRTRKLDNGGKLSKDICAKLFILQKGLCPCCKQPLGSNYHLDHIMPLRLGGANTDNNIQLLRQQCNNQKHAKHPVDFMRSRGFLC